jgi:hypothetical protein
LCHAVVCYDSLRTALVDPDDLSNETLLALAQRASEASERYDADNGGPVQAAENAVLVAYATYLCAVVRERLADKPVHEVEHVTAFLSDDRCVCGDKVGHITPCNGGA